MGVPDVSYLFSRASSRLYQCDTSAFSSAESLTIVDVFVKDTNKSTPKNLFCSDSRLEFLQVVKCVG